MSTITLWTIDRRKCVLCFDSVKSEYDLQVIEGDDLLLEQLTALPEDVARTALDWKHQYAAKQAITRH